MCYFVRNLSILQYNCYNMFLIGKAASGNSTKTGYHEKYLPGLCGQCRVSNKVNPSSKYIYLIQIS